jgi:hypothetical protein
VVEAAKEKVSEVRWATRKQKDLEAEHGTDKAKVIMEDAVKNQRMTRSRLFPTDPSENEYLVMCERAFTDKRSTSESWEASGQMDMDTEMAAAMVGEEGLMSAESLPDMAGFSENTVAGMMGELANVEVPPTGPRKQKPAVSPRGPVPVHYII